MYDTADHQIVPRIVLLNGPAGVGKTTVGERVAGGARNGVCIHGDDLKRFVVTRQDGTVASGLSYLGGAALAEVYLDAGYDLVVFEFVFERSAHVAQFRSGLRTGHPVAMVTLWAPLEVVVERERGRPGRERLGERVSSCWEALREHLPGLGTVVDATGPLDDVVAAVRQACRLDS
ncbi:MAG TPA: AAA family ATPase [Mycobacteriales bacterium]|jgi:chloramphenicol 3-O-phosphotransferase|nr:AAA family ATPase [Mycobacteriales bacterium]